MHLKRQKAITKLPIERKGTKFVARAFSHVNSSVPLVIAIRDMLKLGHNASEVKKMIAQKLLTINGRPVKELRESILLFNVLGADKNYILTLLPTGKFTFEEAKNAGTRLCKLVGKTLLKGNKIQLNLHDGTNIISDKKVAVGDSLIISMKGEIKESITFEKGKKVLITSGKYTGLKGKIESVEGKKVNVMLENEKSALLEREHLIVQ